MRPGGLLLLHISNIVLNLQPVAQGFADHLGRKAVFLISREDSDTGESTSDWVLITANQEFLDRSGLERAGVRWLGQGNRPITWTDDFSSLWHVVDFRRSVGMH